MLLNRIVSACQQFFDFGTIPSRINHVHLRLFYPRRIKAFFQQGDDFLGITRSVDNQTDFIFLVVQYLTKNKKTFLLLRGGDRGISFCVEQFLAHQS